MSGVTGLVILGSILFVSALTLSYIYVREKMRDVEMVSQLITSFLDQITGKNKEEPRGGKE